MVPKKGRHSDMDAAVLHFIQETLVKEMPVNIAGCK
jgi:hypothetical protein